MSKESLWLVETGGGTGLKITSEPLTERKPVGSDGRSRYRASLSGRKAKRVVPQRFSPLSLYGDEGVFVFRSKILLYFGGNYGIQADTEYG